jgi:hypothetical protein
MKIKGRIVLHSQEGGYVSPAITIEPPLVGEYLEPRYFDGIFEKLCGKELRDVPGYDPKLDCGEYEITIKKVK